MAKTIISFVGLAVAIAIFVMYTQPAYDGIQIEEAQIGEYDRALERAAELQRLKQSLLSRFNTFNPADVDRLQKLLPDHVDNVRLVLDLDSLAARHGMALQNVVISSPTSGAGERSAVSVIGGGRQPFDSLTLKFSTLGSYGSFRSFIEDLESSLRVVDLVALKLEPEMTLATAEGDLVYKYDITLRTYWLK